MRIRVKRTRRVQYPAAGVLSDVEALLQKFVDTKSIRYEEFARLWREGNYSLIHAGRNGLRENREFMEEAFKIILKFVLPPYSLQVRVGAMYVLYSMYHTQRAKMKIKVRVPLSCWRDVKELHEQVVTHKHLDIDYIIRKMIHEGVFEHVAYPSPLTIDDFYNDDDDCEEDDFVEESDKDWQKDVSSIHKLLDEDSLGQLNAVHNKYHQLKCQLHATLGGDPNTPSSSLDLIQSDVVGTIVRVAQTPEISLTSPQQRKKGKSPRRKAVEASSEESASERASRISEIKKRALSARANTDSGSLRYLNTSPDPVGQSPERETKPSGAAQTKTPKERRGRKRKELPPLELESNSEELSDDDIIQGVISTIGPASTKKPRPQKRAPSRKAKQNAHSKLKRVVNDNDSNDDDGLLDDDDDDDFDFEKECSGLRADGRASQRPNLLRSSLDRDGGGDGINNSPMRKANIAASAGRKKKSVGQSILSDQSPDELKETCQNRSSSAASMSDDSSPPGSHEKTNAAKRPKLSNLSFISVPTDKESLNIEINHNDLVVFKPIGKRKNRPLIGRVVTFTKSFVEIIWYAGSYSTKWVELGVEKGEDKKIQREQISRQHVLMAGIEFTSSGKLPVKLMKGLRRTYAELENETLQ